jgi:hypothetical protein
MAAEEVREKGKMFPLPLRGRGMQGEGEMLLVFP